MQTPTEEQLGKLPKWAQSYIAGLEMRLGESRKAVAELRKGPEDSNVRIDHYSEQAEHLLGKDTPVTFDVLMTRINSELAPARQRITVQHAGPFTLEIRSDGGSLHVIPSHANVIKLRVGGW